MSSFNMAKNKLQPAYKKAWKSFTTSLQSKLRKSNFSESIKTTKKRCFNAFQAFQSFVFRKLRALRRRSTKRYRCHHYSHTPTIYVDELFHTPNHDAFSEASSSGVSKCKADHSVIMSVEKEQEYHYEDHVAISSGVKINFNALDKWKQMNMLPQFKGIDERAEEFISKFREEKRLEREQSLIDFQERLDRSA